MKIFWVNYIRNFPGVILGTPAGCPWDTRRDKHVQGSTGRCPRDFLLFTVEKVTEKGYVIFAYVPFPLPRGAKCEGRKFKVSDTPSQGPAKDEERLSAAMGRVFRGLGGVFVVNGAGKEGGPLRGGLGP